MRMKLLGTLVGVLFAATSQAAPLYYTYTGSWTDFSSAPFGPDYSATVVFDNGGSTIDNQVFNQSDFVSATIVSGAYNVTMTATNVNTWTIDFSSDGAGRLGAGWFDLSDASSSWHFDTWFPDVTVSNAVGSAGYFSSNLSDPGALGVPEPATFSLLALGLVGIGLARRKA